MSAIGTGKKRRPTVSSRKLSPDNDIKKEHKRFHPAEKWKQEIRKYQRSSELLIRKLPFGRLVREIAQTVNNNDFKWTSHAMEALQEAAEAYLCDLIYDSYLCSIHAKRITLMQKDIALAWRIRGRN